MSTTASPAPERLSGAIERVTFHNPDSGFCVLRVKARGARELLTVVGAAAAGGAHCPAARPGAGGQADRGRRLTKLRERLQEHFR